jgi:hypothetical protein
MTDAERLLRHMKRGNEVAVTDWADKYTPDGGKPILRVAARILDLKHAGHPVERVGTKNRCATYALVYEPRLFSTEAA